MGNNGENNVYSQNDYSNKQHAHIEPQPENETNKTKDLVYIIIIALLLIGLVLTLITRREKYAVVYVDGESISVDVVKEGVKATEKIINDRKFLGWYLEEQKYDFETEIKGNIILRAKYDNFNSYKVTFDTDGGNTIESTTVKENEKVAKPSDPTKEGYTFVEWQLNGKKYDFNTQITSDIILTAKWLKSGNEIAYIVTFDTDGGNTIESATVKENEKVTKPTNPIKEGYAFVEWQLNGAKYDFNKNVTSDMILKAVWKKKEKLTITFDSDGGSNVKAIEIYSGDKIGTLPTPTKTGYAFDGWYSGTTKYTSSTIVTKAVTLKAKWLSEDEKLLNSAKKSIKSSYNIEKSGQSINPTYAGCEITNLSTSLLNGKIVRGTTDKTETLSFEIECGSAKETVTSKGIIKASPYTYSATPNANQTNYDVTVKKSGAKISDSGEIYSLTGSYLSDLQSGAAVINNADIEGNPNFQMTFIGDSKTIYVIKKK